MSNLYECCVGHLFNEFLRSHSMPRDLVKILAYRRSIDDSDVSMACMGKFRLQSSITLSNSTTNDMFDQKKALATAENLCPVQMTCPRINLTAENSDHHTNC